MLTLTTEQKNFLICYTPENRIYTTGEEMDLVADALKLRDAEANYLIEIRNLVVHFYSREVDKLRKRNEDDYSLWQGMMSVTAVIDHYKWNKGLEV